MLHNDAAQQRPGKKPASAPEASQKPPQAQGRANLTNPTLQRMSSRPGDTTAASLTDGNMDTPHISLIHGRHSPPPRWDPTPHATKHSAATTWPGKNHAAKSQAPGPACTIPSLRGRTRASPLGAQRKAGQHSDYSNFSIHTLYTAEILQQADGGREEEARATTLCMAWHAQQETSGCATIPTDTGRRGHSASTTNFAAGGVAMQVQYKQGQTAKET